MSTQMNVTTVVTIAAAIFVGVLAYGVRHGFVPAVSLPAESVRMQLIPLPPAAKKMADSACCIDADRP